MPAVDYYIVLGVARDASSGTIRAVYRALAKTLHPDVGGTPEDAARFAKVAEAYEILSDREKRRAYDDSLLSARASAGTPEGGWAQGHYAWVNVAAPRSETRTDVSEFDDLYDTFFGGPDTADSGESSGGTPPSGSATPPRA